MNGRYNNQYVNITAKPTRKCTYIVWLVMVEKQTYIFHLSSVIKRLHYSCECQYIRLIKIYLKGKIICKHLAINWLIHYVCRTFIHNSFIICANVWIKINIYELTMNVFINSTGICFIFLLCWYYLHYFTISDLKVTLPCCVWRPKEKFNICFI